MDTFRPNCGNHGLCGSDNTLLTQPLLIGLQEVESIYPERVSSPAPTDDAFAALPAGTLDSLVLPENKQQFTDILLYHVVAGKVMATDVVGLDGQSAETALAGNSISIKIDGESVTLNDSVNVIITDIETSNGVIHVIDAVLLPPQ